MYINVYTYVNCICIQSYMIISGPAKNMFHLTVVTIINYRFWGPYVWCHCHFLGVVVALQGFVHISDKKVLQYKSGLQPFWPWLILILKMAIDYVDAFGFRRQASSSKIGFSIDWEIFNDIHLPKIALQRFPLISDNWSDSSCFGDPIPIIYHLDFKNPIIHPIPMLVGGFNSEKY